MRFPLSETRLDVTEHGHLSYCSAHQSQLWLTKVRPRHAVMDVFMIGGSASTREPGNYIQMHSAQLSYRALGLVFRVDPEYLYLVSENSSVELPDERGVFDVDCMDRHNAQGN